ncbi:TnsD family Tn7-like transposition protein [Caenispirillum salinarum]|uniref:TnsD family Tn7-like transposition protein n=1 Tax=Caenispirillum salinarum TaxID=859058 RepID=UPI00384F2EB7
MLGFLPTPRPDETLYGLIARCAMALGFPPRAPLMRTLFGREWPPGLVDGAPPLAALAAALPAAPETTAGRLLLDHTLWPYATRFAPNAAVATAVAAGWDRPALRGALAAAARPPALLRHCPACSAADRAHFGAATWRRLPQIAGVAVCPRHAARLRATTLSAGEARRRRRVVPLDAVIGTGDLAPAGPPPTPAERAVARDAWVLLRAPPGPPAATVRARLRRGLRAAGFRPRGGGAVATGRLAAALLAPDGRLAAAGAAPPPATFRFVLIRALHDPSATLHPLLVAALADLAGLPLADLLRPPGDADGDGGSADFGPIDRSAAAAAAGRNATAAAPCGNPLCRRYRGPPAAALAATRRAPATIACGACGFVYRWRPARPRQTALVAPGAAWERALVRLVGAGGLGLRALARRLGVAPQTVRRHADRLGVERPDWRPRPRCADRRGRRRAAARAAARAAWRAERARRPDGRAADLPAPARAAYRFLLRHDRAWYAAHAPLRRPPRRSGDRGVDWDARDAAWTAAAAAHLAAAPGSTTASAVAAALEAHDTVMANRARLPRLWALIARATGRRYAGVPSSHGCPLTQSYRTDAEAPP